MSVAGRSAEDGAIIFPRIGRPGEYFTDVPYSKTDTAPERRGRLQAMFILEEFRAGQYSLPFACANELPQCCCRCVYLLHEESNVCFCEAPFYYYCGYSWPDRITQTIPPCLEED